jgi:hypothetical protein
MEMEATCFFETSIDFKRAVLSRNPKYRTLEPQLSLEFLQFLSFEEYSVFWDVIQRILIGLMPEYAM